MFSSSDLFQGLYHIDAMPIRKKANTKSYRTEPLPDNHPAPPQTLPKSSFLFCCVYYRTRRIAAGLPVAGLANHSEDTESILKRRAEQIANPNQPAATKKPKKDRKKKPSTENDPAPTGSDKTAQERITALKDEMAARLKAKRAEGSTSSPAAAAVTPDESITPDLKGKDNKDNKAMALAILNAAKQNKMSRDEKVATAYFKNAPNVYPHLENYPVDGCRLLVVGDGNLTYCQKLCEHAKFAERNGHSAVCDLLRQ